MLGLLFFRELYKVYYGMIDYFYKGGNENDIICDFSTDISLIGGDYCGGGKCYRGSRNRIIW